jgi:hypothetical protein
MFCKTVDEGGDGLSVDGGSVFHGGHVCLDVLMEKTLFVVGVGIFSHGFEDDVYYIGESEVFECGCDEFVDGEVEVGDVIWIFSRIIIEIVG